jgi:hypothetical protein
VLKGNGGREIVGCIIEFGTIVHGPTPMISAIYACAGLQEETNASKR